MTADEEIDVFDLLAILWTRKVLIVCISLAFFLGGLLFVFFATPIYEASAKLIPSTAADLRGSPILTGLALGPHMFNTETEVPTPESGFERGLAQLTHLQTQLPIFLAHREGFISESADEAEASRRFGALVKVDKSKRNGGVSATLSFRHPNNEYARNIVAALVAQANTDTCLTLGEDLRSLLHTRIALLQTRLQQAIALREPTGSGDARSDNLEYLDDTITDLQLEINTLNAYANQSYDTVNMLRIDGEIALPSVPVTPRKKLILILSVFTGGFLGVLVALVLEALAKRKAETNARIL